MQSVDKSGIFVHKFSKLAEWQRIQREKLLQEQETQRQILNQEQQRIFEVYGGGSHPRDIVLDTTKQEPRLSSLNKESDVNMPAFNSVEKQSILLDDVPLPVPNKNFLENLQEKLHEEARTSTGRRSSIPKKPFLRKGQGLARFRLTPNFHQKLIKNTASKPKQISRPNAGDKDVYCTTTRQNVQDTATDVINSGVNVKICSNSRHLNASNRKNVNTNDQAVSKAGVATAVQINAGSDTSVPTWSHIFSRQQPFRVETNVTQETKKHSPTWSHIFSQSQQHKEQKQEADVSLEKKRRELEELRVFELLEEKAANSSFCSTSSAIAQLMAKSIQSTPLKTRNPRQEDTSDNETSHHVHFADTDEYKSTSYYSDSESQCLPEESMDSQTNQETEQLSKPVSWGEISPSINSNNPHTTASYTSDEDEVLLTNRSEQQNFHDTDVWSSEDEDSVKNGSESHTGSDYSDCDSEPSSKHHSIAKQSVIRHIPSKVSQDNFSDHEQKSNSPDRLAPENLVNQNWPASKTSLERNDVNYEPSNSAYESNTFLQKSELLRNRLQELEKEIETFRRENAALSKLRRNHELEVAKFRKESKEAEIRLQKQHEDVQAYLDAEKKKLAKEKLVYERYTKPKESKNQPSKAEREEITALKIQVEHLREELLKKDNRWSATQIRTRDRLKHLENENAELKKVIKNLKQERQEARQYKIRLENEPTKQVVSNTKVIHAINNHIGKIKPKEDLKHTLVIKNVVPKYPIPKSVFNKRLSQGCNKDQGSTEKRNLRRIQSVPDMGPSSSLENLHEAIQVVQSSSDSESDSDSGIVVRHEKVGAQLEKMRQAVYDTLYTPLPESEMSLIHETNQESQQIEDTRCNPKCSPEPKSSPSMQSSPSYMHMDKEATRKAEKVTSRLNICDQQDNVLHEAPKVSISVKDITANTVVESIKENGNREKVYSDGRKEVWYPNGNVKKVSADKTVIKIIYFNGDVKETLVKDNIVKYYYAETRTWHTTYPDGQEILEFPNGQVERRLPDGTMEITFSNGCVRVSHPDGQDQWSFPDGTKIKTTSTGEKVVSLANGQREVHTLEHKRREYPDGTVKLVYPDGLQETRYANGRLRLKDKHGNLILDSAVET